METRIKWLSSPKVDGRGLQALAVAARQMPFTKDAAKGFVAAEVRSGSVSGRFIERIAGRKVFTDPFGGKFELPFIIFETTIFRISSTFPQVELINAPRSIKRFLNQISELIDDPFSIEPLSLDLVRWIDALADKLGKPRVEELRCSDLPLTPALFADMTLSGSEDVLSSTRRFLGKNFRNVYYARVGFDLGARKLEMALNASGSLRAFSEFDQRFMGVLREAIALANTRQDSNH